MTEQPKVTIMRKRPIMGRLVAALMLAGSGFALSGCVVAPASPGYYGRHYSYGYGYRAPRPYYQSHAYYRPYW
jgi:hypothetical protein